jgi:hypothetical protein
MSDQKKVTLLKDQIRDLESKRREVIRGRFQQSGRLLAEIDRELQSRGWFTFSPSPVLLPREYDPDGELRHLNDQIKKLGKDLVGEEEKR